MKITVVGGGFVGSTVAQLLMYKKLGNVVLHDVLEGMPQGKSLDLMQSACLEGFDTCIKGTNDPADYEGSDIVVITSGVARKPGMSRDDLLITNSKIVSEVVENVKKYAPNAIIVTVTNPLDVMTYLVGVKSGFPKNRILGMAGVLDSARFRCFIAMELGVSHKDVDAMVLGGHGDDMVPLARYATVSGIALEDLLPKEKIQALIDRTRHGGAEIVQLLKQGSAYYAPAASAVQMVQSIVLNEKRILAAAAWCTGQYGIHNQFVGVPVCLGRQGVERVIELKLTAEELSLLQASANRVGEIAKKLNF